MDGNAPFPFSRRRSLQRDDLPDTADDGVAAGPEARRRGPADKPRPAAASPNRAAPPGGADPADSAAVALDGATLDHLIHALEADLPQLQVRSSGVFALAHAWAERHDAILARTPPALLPTAQARLRRLGIRWGLASGSRVTREFPALPPLARWRPKPRR